MQRIWPFIVLPLLLLLLIFPPIFAQDGSLDDHDDEPEPAPPVIETDWYDYEMSLYSRGDRTFNMALGVIFPAMFYGLENDIGLSIGGTGTLGYHYFLSPNLFIGGELSGKFSFSRSGNSFFVIPFGFKVGYQFLFRRFEFPVGIMAGFAPQRFHRETYFGFILRPGASAFWRYNPDWSFGVNAVWWFLPQWPRGGPDAYGNFLELTLSARYHF